MNYKVLFRSLLAFLLILSTISTVLPTKQADAAANFIYPLHGTITTDYGPDILNGKPRTHHGIDIDGNTGDPVKASATGTVIKSEWSDSYGNWIIVRHTVGGKTFETVYAHLSSRLVSANEKVTQDEVIGKVGNTGESYGSHLHFELHEGTWNGAKSNSIDPLSRLEKSSITKDHFIVYARLKSKEATDLGKYPTLEEAKKKMNQYNYTSVVNLDTGEEVATKGTPKDIKVYFGNEETGDSYAEFSTKTAARNFLDLYQNMVAVDTETWEQFDWTVSNSKKYGAFNGSNGIRKDFGVKNAAIDYLKSNYTNALVINKTIRNPYPKVIWESDENLPEKYLVTDGTYSQSYSIYTAAVYAKESRPGSEIEPQ
jgi:hypothetical protein